MKWSVEADKAVGKVPFFVRKRVRNKVETFAKENGKQRVDLEDVTAVKKKFLSKGGMEKEIKGFQVDTCFGSDGCPNRANSGTKLAGEIETLLKEENILSFLKANVKGDLKFHHEFRVSLSDCPNACSRPQIADIGIIGAVSPKVTDEDCTLCSQCVFSCREEAIFLDETLEKPVINMDLCLKCAHCIHACPTGTIAEEQKGFRVFLGGRLGRHPRLAMEVHGILSHDQVIDIVKKCLKFYKTHSRNGKRFAHLFKRVDQVLG
ncbi:MAG: 4Fe-4S dicluster domain-containing protein [Desulfobacteraceae bacterium]|nr:4Fe-4S dicluster domain-containing protein [Desulfobacteraceae bacterium]